VLSEQGTGWYYRLEALERSGARIYFGHDPEFWRSVPQAPAAIV
jgi:hypothetical protein